MVILNIGMPRSGTLWRYRLINNLVMADGGKDGVAVRNKYYLQPFISDVNADISTLSNKRLIPALIPSYLGERYTLNTHAKPSPLAIKLLQNNKIKAIYGYRDPRDCILSMLEYSDRALPQYSSVFLKLSDVEQAVAYFQTYLNGWEKWIQAPKTLIIKYESMLDSFDSIIEAITDYLELDLPDGEISLIKDKFRPKQKSAEDIHFQHGEASRHKHQFSQEELNYLAIQLKEYIERMGYQI